MNSRKSFHREVKMLIAGGFTCQRYGFNVGADKFSLLTIENGKNKHYAPIGMDIDFPKPKISLRQAASVRCSSVNLNDRSYDMEQEGRGHCVRETSSLTIQVTES